MNMKRILSALLLAAVLLGPLSLSAADELTQPLSQLVPFGVTHSEDGSAIPVYRTAGARNRADTLADYQLCAILGTQTVSRKTWYEVRYLAGGALKDGFVSEDAFYQLTLAGLVTVTASATETLQALIQASNPALLAVQAPAAAATPTPKGRVTATPKSKATATPSTGRKRYVLNTKTLKFHLPGCSDVLQIAPENKKTTTTTRESLIEQGYTPCKRCDP